jgi:hypothetical protein
MTSHELMGGKLQVYQRGNSRFWQCAASVGGKQRRASTKEESLALAKQVAEDSCRKSGASGSTASGGEARRADVWAGTGSRL